MCKQKNNVLSFIHLIIVYILRISQVYNKKIIFITKINRRENVEKLDVYFFKWKEQKWGS